MEVNAKASSYPFKRKFLLPGVDLGLGGSILVGILNVITFIYDRIALSFYHFMQRPSPSKKLEEHFRQKSVLKENKGDSKTWSTPPSMSKKLLVSSIQDDLIQENVDTMAKVFTFGFKKYSNKACLGTRELLHEEEEVQADGKVFKKWVLGDYHWKTYTEIKQRSDDLANGFAALGLKGKGRLCVFAETREEWFLTVMAAFKKNITIVTLYATLGEEAVVHGVNETEATVLLTSEELLPKLKNVLKHTPSIKHVIYMEHPLSKNKKHDINGNENNNNEKELAVETHAFQDVIEMGKKYYDTKPETATPDDLAIIMYTSGSTGQPKGVMLSQRNMYAGLVGLLDALGDVNYDDIFIGYLPLAHVFEMISECVIFMQGVRIGYSSPQSITDKSPKIKSGTKGDAFTLSPTLMISVPFAMDKIYKGIMDQVNSGGLLTKILFYYFYDYKLNWYYKGYRTPLTDAVIFKKARMLLGGQVRLMITGGAPLAHDTQEFLRNVMGAPIKQGYGLTETSSCATAATTHDISVGRVGPPLRGVEMRLANWEEGGYTVHDEPRPRGEIIIGGDNVSVGYLKMPEATASEFYEENGRRWFKTGDIGEVDEDGVFKIIDRKKDLVKLQMGEYLSLGKVESVLKMCPYVDNIWVYGDAMEQCCVAVITPSQKGLESILGKEITVAQIEELCNDPRIESRILKELHSYAVVSKLQRFEIPQRIKLSEEIWTSDNGLVTAAFKLRRKPLFERYKSDVGKMYKDFNSTKN